MHKLAAGNVGLDLDDMRIAKKRLLEKGLTLCIVRDGHVLFETHSHGISGFLRAIQELGEGIRAASAADKVIGKAVALLCLYTNIRAVYASLISSKARELFEEKAVWAEYDELVENIIGEFKPTTCPFENLAAKITDPSEAYVRLKALQDSLGNADERMNSEHNRSSSEGKELERIRQKRISELKEKQEITGKPVHVTDSNFNELTVKRALALVDFWAAWCGPCQSLAPIIEEMAKEYEGKIFIGKLNVDDNPQTAERFQVFSIPTMIIMKNGKEVDRIVGCVQKKYIEETLEKHFK